MLCVGFKSSELTHRTWLVCVCVCVPLHPELPSCLTSLTDSKVATVGLTGFIYQISWCSHEHKEGEKKEKKKGKNCPQFNKSVISFGGKSAAPEFI